MTIQKIGQEGQIKIPAAYMKQLGFKEQDNLQTKIKHNTITLTKL